MQLATTQRKMQLTWSSWDINLPASSAFKQHQYSSNLRKHYPTHFNINFITNTTRMSYTIPITMANLTSKHIQTIPFISPVLFETIGSSNLMRQLLAQAKLPQYWLRAQQVYVI